MGYTRSEQETSIVWDEDQKKARVYTASPVTMRKLDKLTEQCPEAYRRTWVEGPGTAARYEVDAKYIRFGKPASEARKAAGRQAAARMRSVPRKDRL